MRVRESEVFTPARERRRHARLLGRIRAGSLLRPVRVLCPRQGLRRALEDRVARAGGAFARFMDWDELTRALEDALGLPFVATPQETERALAVERCLAARAVSNPSLVEPLRSDPFGVAAGLLRVVDILRAHRWDGRTPAPSGGAVAGGDTRAARLIDSHIELLGAVQAELEAWMTTARALDRIGRMRRVIDALARSPVRLFPVLLAEGIDLVTPVERDLLLAIGAHGTEVDVAPWVIGWTPRPGHIDVAQRHDAGTAADLLEAFDRGVDVCLQDDRAVTAVSARDPYEEAEQVALWVAEQVARGMPPDDITVVVSPEPGALDRMRRALARYGVRGDGVGEVPVREMPLWQVVRASVRLAWRGADVIDLATVLAAPGSGVWGADRDRLCALLRREVPTSWRGVREVLERATEAPAANPPDASREDGAALLSLDDEAHANEAARAAHLKAVRERVSELIAVWESEGPFATKPAPTRLASLARVVRATLARFAQPTRFFEAMDDARAQQLWISAAVSIRAACEAALERLEKGEVALPPHAPGVFLGTAEALLGAVPDASFPPRADGVTLLVNDPFPSRRPGVLVVTGFNRGRFPTTVARPLVLGLLERDRLAEAGGDVARIPSEGDLGAVALRETFRLLALPTRRLVLVMPHYTAEGERVDVALAWRDILARLPAEARVSRERNGVPTFERWLKDEFPDGPRTRRGRALAAMALLGGGHANEAAALARPLAQERQSTRDLFAARFRPELRFDLGDLVQDQYTRTVFTPRSLETLLTCRYSFLTGTLLGLRPLRLARAPTVTAMDRVRVTRAALRALDEVAKTGRSPDERDLAASLDAAVASELPWAERAEMHFALEDLQRTVRGFLKRYAELRRTWKLDVVRDAPSDPAAEPVTVAVPSERVKELRVAPVSSRVEATVRADDGSAQTLVVDLRAGGTSGFGALRGAGLDLDAALVPALAAAGAGDVAAFVRLSLTRAEGEVLTGGDVALDAGGTTTLVTLDPSRRLREHREATMKRLGETLDAVTGDGGSYAPHDAAQADALHKMNVHTCSRCGMRLGCRFRMAGEARGG